MSSLHYTRWMLIVLAVVLFITIFYGWPGLWRYKYYDHGCVKIDRLTGEIDRLTWEEVHEQY